MNQASSISISISLVRKELEATLQKAEGYFAKFAEVSDLNDLKLFADELNLARGTFKLLELKGPESLTTEMLSLIGDGAVKLDTKIEALGQALLGLGQYLDVLLENERDYPVLVIPFVNLVRKAGGHKPISDAHFFNVNLRPQLPQIEKSTLNLKPHLARLRLMYQAGLVRVLRSKEEKVGFKLIERSLSLLEQGCRGSVAWSFWWAAHQTVSVMVREDYELTLNRKLLFGRLDLLMKLMIKEGVKVFTSAQANQVLKDLLYVIAISETETGEVAKIKSCFVLKSSETEKDLKKIRKAMSGPDIHAWEALSRSLKEEIAAVKSALDSAAKDVLNEDGYDELSVKLIDISNVLKVVHQEPLSEVVKQQQGFVKNVAASTSPDRVESLAKIADALLQVELACDGFAKGQVANDGGIIGAGHYYEARLVLFDEIQAGLSVAKRALASYSETGDKLHLVNIGSALTGVKGGLIFLDHGRAANVVASAVDFLDKKVVNTDMPADGARIEVLADALTSVEYFAETLSQSDVGGQDILELAVKSIGQLGYKV